MAALSGIVVEVAYAAVEAQSVRRVELDAGATLQEAIGKSGVLARFPQIDLDRYPVGIFGRLRPLDFPLAHGDRVEIYRPLIVDPKTARRQRAARKFKAGAYPG